VFLARCVSWMSTGRKFLSLNERYKLIIRWIFQLGNQKTEDDQIIIDRQKDVRSCRKMDGPSLDCRTFYGKLMLVEKFFFFGGGVYFSIFWSRTRKAACRLEARIDESHSNVIADGISCVSAKAVRGLRTDIRKL
jgi:hypothetical protein